MHLIRLPPCIRPPVMGLLRKPLSESLSPQRWPRFQLLSGKARPCTTSHPGSVQEPLTADTIVGVCFDTTCRLFLERRTATSGHGMLSQWTPLTTQLIRARALQRVAQAGGGSDLSQNGYSVSLSFSLSLSVSLSLSLLLLLGIRGA